jgi:ABC-type transporter Mla subunit MlaD
MTKHTPTLDKVNAAIDSAPARLHAVRNAFAQIREAVEQAEKERDELVAALRKIDEFEDSLSSEGAAAIARDALAKVQQ